MIQKPIVVVGAGAAGIGIGVLLKRLDLPFVIVDQHEVGASFRRWAKETQFISPSFTGNAFGSVDLNAVTPDTSPAFSLKCEHPTGADYARYLDGIVKSFELPVRTGIRVDAVNRDKQSSSGFTLQTSQGDINTEYLIWAAGEYQYPKRDNFEGAQMAIHYADVEAWSTLGGEHFYVIGGYESGIDAAYHLAKLGKRVTVFDGDNQLNKHGSDSSYTLSPFTRERYRSVADAIEVINDRVVSIEKVDEDFEITTANNSTYSTPSAPIDCTGFVSSLQLVKSLFDFDQGHVQLSEVDESTICPNLFLTGPQVRHGEALFCFIYKFRQRFGIIGEVLAERMGVDRDMRIQMINYYRNNQFYMDDLSCCEDECVC